MCSETVETRAASDEPAPPPERRAEGSKMQMEPSVMPPAMIPLLPVLPTDQSMEENRLAVLTLPKTLGVGLSSGLVMLKLYSSSSPP